MVQSIIFNKLLLNGVLSNKHNYIMFTLSPVLQDALHAFHCHLQHFGILHL